MFELPTIPPLDAILGGLLVVAVIGGLVERSNYLEEKAGRLADHDAAVTAAFNAQQADAKATAIIETKHAKEIATIRANLTSRDASIIRAAPSAACVGSPPMGVLFDGLRTYPNYTSPSKPLSPN